jgi:triacylglycerol lipase
MFPIILAHGIARFDILRQRVADELSLSPNALDDELQYFRNIRTHLGAHGFSSVFNTNVDFAGSVDLRAGQLKKQINEILAATGAAKVHIIAHSMGGLDARRMIVDMEMAERIASLTTIGTPHNGTSLADHIIGKGGSLLMLFLKKAVHLDVGGANDLTLVACKAFNERARDAEAKNDVFYQTYASSERGSEIFLPLIASWKFISDKEGNNDGLVPQHSQKWTDELVASDGTRKRVPQNEFPIPADHLNQVGWWNLTESLGSFIDGDFQSRDEYEGRIRNIYLDIVRNLQNLPV